MRSCSLWFLGFVRFLSNRCVPFAFLIHGFAFYMLFPSIFWNTSSAWRHQNREEVRGERHFHRVIFEVTQVSWLGSYKYAGFFKLQSFTLRFVGLIQKCFLNFHYWQAVFGIWTVFLLVLLSPSHPLSHVILITVPLSFIGAHARQQNALRVLIWG